MKESPLLQRDRISEDIVHSYAADNNINTRLVFQGGGAMHLIYGSPRYSSDLDFVCSDLNRSAEELREILGQGATIGRKSIIPEIFSNTEGNICMMRVKYRTPEGIVGRVEIAGVPSFDNAPTTGKYAPLIVERPSEIYIDKIAANLSRMNSRGSIKGSDLFDLNYLAKNLLSGKPEIDKIRQKLTSYSEGELVNSEQLRKVAEHVRDPANRQGIIDQISKTLLPDVFNLMNFDDSYFERAASHFSQYAEGA